MDASRNEPSTTPPPAEDIEHGTEKTTSSDGPVDKIKDAFGKFIGSEGERHGARDTDPSS
jgi:hypothetical protein